jgi:hypothetical protein
MLRVTWAALQQVRPRGATTSIRDGKSVAAAGCNRNRFPCDGDGGVTAELQSASCKHCAGELVSC